MVKSFKEKLKTREELIIKQELELSELRSTIDWLKEASQGFVIQKQLDEFNAQLIEAKKEVYNLGLLINSSKTELIDAFQTFEFKKYDIKSIVQKNNIDIEKMTVMELKEFAINQKNLINMQQLKIYEFKNSIVYSFYKLTSSFGKTSIGKILQRIIK